MFPLAILGAGLNLAGGFAQASQIRRQTEMRLEQMRRQQAQDIGEVTARAGASGVEITSATVQDRLTAMSQEWSKRIAAVAQGGNDAAGLSMLTGAAGAFSGFSKALGQASADLQMVDNAWASPEQRWLDATTPDLNTFEGDFYWGK